MTLLCVHPHPDDETIACGGILARYAAAGRRVVVVTCTGGEAGENLAGIDLGGDGLATHRRRELADALDILGVTEHHWLGYRDSGMVDTPDNQHPDCFARADLDLAAARLAAIIRSVRPDVVVSDDESGGYGHPDHVQAHRVTTRALALAAEPDDTAPSWTVAKRYATTLARSRLVRAHEHLLAAGLPSPFGDEPFEPDEAAFGTPDEAITTRIDVRDELATKRAALAAHRSQIGEDSFFLNLPDQVGGDVFGVEEFTLLAPPPEPGSLLETDLFAGLAPCVDHRARG